MARVIFSKLLTNVYVDDAGNHYSYKLEATYGEKSMEINFGGQVIDIHFPCYGLQVSVFRMEDSPVYLFKLDFHALATRSNVIAAFMGELNRRQELPAFTELVTEIDELRKSQKSEFDREAIKALRKELSKDPTLQLGKVVDKEASPL